MKKFTGTAVLLAALLVAIGALSGAATGKTDAGGPKVPPPVTIQILNVSDWHGNLDPFGTPALGGAWNISARWKEDRASRPTLTLTAGDDFGATPPLSSFFNEEPSVKAQRLMGIQVGALGNHNFDRGVAHLQQMIDLAGAPTGGSVPGQPFSYVAANLKNLDGNLSGVDPVRYFNVGGAKVAVIGITNEEAPSVVLPGSFGTIEITDGVAAANKFARIARKAKSDVVLVITHKGIRSLAEGVPSGELIDFANGIDPNLVDVVFGDHTDVQFTGTINGILVHENRSYGGTYAKTLLTVQPGGPGEAGSVTSKSVAFVTPTPPNPGLQNGNTTCPPAPAFCDQAIVDMLVPYRQQLAALLDGQIGTAAGIFVRGGNIERRQEIPLGDLVADGMRWRYGTQLATDERRRASRSDAIVHVLAGEHGAQAPVYGLRARHAVRPRARRRVQRASVRKHPEHAHRDGRPALAGARERRAGDRLGGQRCRRPLPADLGIQVLVPIRHPDRLHQRDVVRGQPRAVGRAFGRDRDPERRHHVHDGTAELRQPRR